MSAEQIIFFKKNKADYTISGVDATASQGSDYADRVLNRNNISAWMTTGSVDADNTTLTIDMSDYRTISEILLLNHNFRAYTVKYWDGSAYQAFSPAISETTNTATSNWHSVTAQSTTKIQITITGTQTANEDKYLYQCILTELIGQLVGFPIISNVIHSKNRIALPMLSGKQYVVENVGGFSCDLSVEMWKSDADLDIVESIYNESDGVLMWLCGNSTSQFFTQREGYRLEDIYLVKPTNEYQPNWYNGIYANGIGPFTLSLAEAAN